MAEFEHNLAAYNAVEAALGGTGAQPNDMVAVRAIALLEGANGGPASISDDNMVSRLNAIDLRALGTGDHLNTLDALNSIVILNGGLGGHENDLDAINEWVDNVFVGFLDAFPASVGAWSVRRLTVSYTGPIVRVRRSSDNAEMDIGYDGIGDLDTTALLAFVGAGSGFVVRNYDQSGLGFDVSEATASKQPRIVNAGALDTDPDNGRPIMVFDGTDDELETVANYAGDVGLDGDHTFTFSGVFVEPTNSRALTSFLSIEEGGGYWASDRWNYNDPRAFHPTGPITFTNVVYKKSPGTVNPTGVFLRSNQAVQITTYTGGPLTPNVPTSDTWRIGNWSGLFGDVQVSEMILWSVVLTAAQALATETDQQAYYGF